MTTARDTQLEGLATAPRPSVEADRAGAGRDRRRRSAAIVLLTLVGVLNYVDRFLPAVLAEPIKRELQLTDTTLGLINGFGFLVIYAVIGIPIARLADRGRYGLVISASLALWSVMTMAGGLAQSGLHLALTRMGVAVGEAGSTPAAHAYISRNFPPDRRAGPLAVLSLSVPIASMAGLLGGGLVGEALGWRGAFLAMGGLSLLVAPLVLLVLGPGAGRALATDAAPGQSAPRTPLAVFKKRSFLTILAASALVGVGGYTLTAFAPAFLIRTHGFSVGEVGTYYGIASGLFGIVGLVLTGRLADRMSRRDPRWLLWIVAGMALLLLPCLILALLTPDRWAAVWLLAAGYVVGTAYLAPVVVAIQRLVPPETRATASAVLLFCTALAGGAGPLIAGMVSDALQPQLGAAALSRAMLVAPAAWILAVIGFVAAARTFRAELVAEPAA
ncbi:MFS transporter [Phenylobacterium sp. LjRoot219]|uniref:spinster family MFS transporter n=1 Tax=Phenylobacterium sp. LjRoot219 TaxID=3342283 RepID=UPI003ECEA4B4